MMAKICRFAISAGMLALVSLNCFSGRRWNNYYWELDSLRYYTVRMDSLFKNQTVKMEMMRTDFYTKTDELAKKMETLHTRLTELESMLTGMSIKLTTVQKPAPDTMDPTKKITPEARVLYEAAYLNYVKGKYVEAVEGFKAYLKTQPESALSENALYWIGESYAALGKRQDAVDTFKELLAKYSASARKPAALYKIGIIYEEAKDLKTARVFFEQLIKEFPNSNEAVLAKNRLK
jgi:tol-pal system protein YbgF